MTSNPHSLIGGRQVVAEVQSGDDELVDMEDLLELSVEKFGSDKFGDKEFRDVLNELTDGEVTRDGAKIVIANLMDPEMLGGPQVGTGADWNYRLATSVRERHE